MPKRLRSVLTDDMDTCYLTGYAGKVERHHIFGGALRDKSEFYGFVVPLAPFIHPNGASFDAYKCWQTTKLTRREVDLQLKQAAQTYYEMNIGNREKWLLEFGRSYKK